MQLERSFEIELAVSGKNANTRLTDFRLIDRHQSHVILDDFVLLAICGLSL